MIIDNIEINDKNYKQIAKKLCLSYSILQKLIGKREFTKLDGSVCFYDIETDEKGEFILGVVNDKLFKNEKEMLEEISKFNICGGFNNFRFDNEYLFKSNPEYFNTIGFGNFKLHKIKNLINIDLLPIYMLWNPFKVSHRLRELAKDLNFNKQYDLREKEKKCFEDVLVCNKFWSFAKEIFNWIEYNFYIDCETICSLYYKSFSKLRRWILQSFLLQNNIFPIPIKKTDERKLSFFRYAKKGFYEDINVYDVKSAYPTTAIKLNSSLYKKGDFANYLKFILNERQKNPNIETFVKWCANATIGDMNYTDALLYDKKIICDVWLTFEKVMKNWIKGIGLENVIYSYTDCIFTNLKNIPSPKGYQVSLKHKFDWIYIYNLQRYIGLNEENKIHRVHFNRPIKLKLFDYLDKSIDVILKQNPIPFLKNPKLDIDFNKLPDEVFEILVFKKDDVCRNINYLELWEYFHYGLNVVFLSKDGVTTDRKKIDYSQYKKYIDYYLNLHKIEGGGIDENIKSESKKTR